MDGLTYPCIVCVGSRHGICINNQTCHCNDGFLGPTCSDPVTTMQSTTNVGGIVAGVLGGALFALFIGLVTFFMWKRRVKKKLRPLSPSTSMATTVSAASAASAASSAPIVVPALYDISSSRRSSTVTSCPTTSYHLYEELP